MTDSTLGRKFHDAAVLRWSRGAAESATSTRNLLAAESAAGVRHHIALSVVGSERLPASAYFRAKVAQEELIKGGPVPYTIIRATQFFEFVNGIADASTTGTTVRLSTALVQPMAAADAATAVARVAVGPPVNGIVEVAGPQRFRLDDLVRTGLKAQGDSREVTGEPQAPYFGAVLQEGTLLPGDGATLFATRFEDWLTQSVTQ
jgi:uncharacterized protein YbjT (DUF2867 family)